MLPDNLARASFGGKVKGDLLREPGAFDQPRSLVLLMPESAVHHIANAVDKPCPEAAAARKLNFDSFFRDKLRLCGHNGAPGGRLGQLIPGAGAAGLVFDARQ